MELIDRNELLEEIGQDAESDGNQRAAQILECILNAPTVDAVPVVRCKDCQKRNTPDCAMWYQCSICGGQWSWESDNVYCSFGEPRTPPAE